jgi:hypothetical protein
MSAAEPRAISANGAPSDGSVTGTVSPVAGATKALSIKCRGGVTIAGQRECGAFIGGSCAGFARSL